MSTPSTLKMLYQTLKCFNVFGFSLHDISKIQKKIEVSEQLIFRKPTKQHCQVCKAESKCSFIGYDLCQICQEHIESCFVVLNNGSLTIDIDT